MYELPKTDEVRRAKAENRPEGESVREPTPEERRTERLQEIDERIADLENVAKPQEQMGEFEAARENEYTAQVTQVEVALETKLGAESLALIHENLVEDHLATAERTQRTIEELAAEKSSLAGIAEKKERRDPAKAEGAVALLDGYDGTRTVELNNELAVAPEKRVFATPDRSLTFIGSRHSADPESESPQQVHADMEKAFGPGGGLDGDEVTFMIEGQHSGYSLEKAQKDMEGVTSWQEAVKRHGEFGVQMWKAVELAKQGKNVEIMSPEAPEESILESLRGQGMTNEAIATYLAIRQIGGEFRGPQKKDREANARNFARQLYHYQETIGVNWVTEEVDREKFASMTKGEMAAFTESVVKQFLGGMNGWMQEKGLANGPLLDPEALMNGDLSQEAIDEMNLHNHPMNPAHEPRHGAINKVAALWNGERDKTMVREISDAMNRGRKPYVVYGYSHLAHAKPALEKLVS